MLCVDKSRTSKTSNRANLQRWRIKGPQPAYAECVPWENLGSGFPLILNAWNEKHWLKPELLEQPKLMQVKLTLHIQNEPINEPINKPINKALTERQRTILYLIKQNPSFSRVELAEKTGLSLATIKREITILRKNGYIDRDGSNKNGQLLILRKF